MLQLSNNLEGLMLSKFNEWFLFHIEVLDRKKLPYLIWFFGMVVAAISIFFYEKIVTRFHNIPIFSKLIEDNADILWHGLWVIPLVISIFFWRVGVAQHRKDIDKIFN